MKIVFIVLDGAGERGNKTPLALADKPNIDFLAKKGEQGLLDVGYKGKNMDVNSDMGYMVLLGCYSEKEYPGRGYIEALGTDLNPGPNDICIRGNFATLDKRGNILDRRAGRDETGLDEFAERLDGMEIDGVRFTVKKSSGHRVSILLRGEKLSDEVIPNDAMKVGVPLSQVKPKKPEGKFTASVLNKFIYRVNKILSKESINRERKLPANTILIRNAGKAVKVKNFKERFGLKAFSVSGLAVTRGICRFLEIDNIKVRGATGLPNTDLEGKAKAVLENMDRYDFVFLHINGTDTYSHERKPQEKKKFIERIDRVVISKLMEKIKPAENVYIITCDHRSMSDPAYKDYEHLPDPVPVLVSGNGIEQDRFDKWNEKNSEKGFRLKGNELIPWVLRQVS